MSGVSGGLLESRLARSSSLPLGAIRLTLVDQPLFMPSGSSACLCVSSADVIHCFSVPGLGVKVDAIPGRVSWVGLQAPSVGFVADGKVGGG